MVFTARSGIRTGASDDFGSAEAERNSLFGYETIHYRIKGVDTEGMYRSTLGCIYSNLLFQIIEQGTVTSAPGAYRLRGLVSSD